MKIKHRFENKNLHREDHVVNCKYGDETVDKKPNKVNRVHICGIPISISGLKTKKRLGILCLSGLFIFITLCIYYFKSPHQTLHLDEGKQHYPCQGLDFEEEMDEILSIHKQVFITMPAKAAGTAMKAFAEKCMKGDTNMIDNVLTDPKNVRKLLTGPLNPPSIIVSHSYDSNVLRRLAKHATRDSLIVYIHREETDRLLSGIRNVVGDRMCPEIKENDTCVIQEEALLQRIERRDTEIGMAVTDILTCLTFEEIRDNAPNMVVVDYRQASQLQRLLAKHHCPELLDSPVHKNDSFNKENSNALVQLTDDSTKLPSSLHAHPGVFVSLTDWLNAKRNILELSLNLKRDATCQSNVREMEDKLYACQDHAILFEKYF